MDDVPRVQLLAAISHSTVHHSRDYDVTGSVLLHCGSLGEECSGTVVRFSGTVVQY